MQYIPTTFFEQGISLEGSGGITGTYTSSLFEYTYHKFISGSGTFTINSGDGYVDLLIVGGGGRGATVTSSGLNGNGGGGGGVTYISNLFVKSGDSFTVSVGEGGISGSADGKQSFFSSSAVAYFASGGFSNGNSGNGFTVGTNALCGGANTPGGGASSEQNGQNGACSPRKSGNGANGQEWQFEPTVYRFGAGGGGGIEVASGQGTGGLTGGGSGGSFAQFAVTGSANLGAGGGGGGNGQQGANGGRGVVYVRYIKKSL